MSIASASSFGSIIWSHNHLGGNFLDSLLLKTLACFLYCREIQVSSSVMAVGRDIMTLPTMVCILDLIWQGRNHALAVSDALSTIESLLYAIHPLA
jgi:hypothetical protein